MNYGFDDTFVGRDAGADEADIPMLKKDSRRVLVDKIPSSGAVRPVQQVRKSLSSTKREESDSERFSLTSFASRSSRSRST